MSSISDTPLMTIDSTGLIIENNSGIPDKAAGGITSITKDAQALADFFKQAKSKGDDPDAEYDEDQKEQTEDHTYFHKVNIRFESKLF